MTTAMDENPYQSPIDASAETPETARPDRGSYAGMKLIVGPFMGAVFGGVFGAIGGATAFLIVGMLEGLPIAEGLGIGFVAGGILGCILGTPVGLILGIVGCFVEPSGQPVLVGVSAVLSGIVGVVCGVWHPVFLVCGLLAGVGGGFFLGKALTRLFWGEVAEDNTEGIEVAELCKTLRATFHIFHAIDNRRGHRGHNVMAVVPSRGDVFAMN